MLQTLTQSAPWFPSQEKQLLIKLGAGWRLPESGRAQKAQKQPSSLLMSVLIRKAKTGVSAWHSFRPVMETH